MDAQKGADLLQILMEHLLSTFLLYSFYIFSQPISFAFLAIQEALSNDSSYPYIQDSILYSQ